MQLINKYIVAGQLSLLALWTLPAVASDDAIMRNAQPETYVKHQVPGLDDERWSDFLPLLKQEAEANLPPGVNLPLPFGVNLSLTNIGRNTKVSEIQAGVSPQLQDVDFANVAADTDVSSLMLRLDAWVLPFLNVYGLLGYTDTQTNVSVDVDLDKVLPDELVIKPTLPGRPPRIIPVPELGIYHVDFDTSGQSPTYGFGANWSAGSEDFFLSSDVNWTWTKLGGVLDQTISGTVASMRAGYNTHYHKSPANLWLSATYWDTKRRMDGSVPLNAAEELHFSIVQEPENPWTFGLGGQATFHRHWMAVFQLQTDFDGMNGATFSLGYRF